MNLRPLYIGLQYIFCLNLIHPALFIGKVVFIAMHAYPRWKYNSSKLSLHILQAYNCLDVWFRIAISSQLAVACYWLYRRVAVEVFFTAVCEDDARRINSTASVCLSCLPTCSHVRRPVRGIRTPT